MPQLPIAGEEPTLHDSHREYFLSVYGDAGAARGRVHWRFAEALAWVATRNLPFVDGIALRWRDVEKPPELRDVYYAKLELASTLCRCRGGMKTCACWVRAAKDLQEYCVAGEIVGYAADADTGRVGKIEPEEWLARGAVSLDLLAELDRPVPGRGVVSFRTDDLLTFFPADASPTPLRFLMSDAERQEADRLRERKSLDALGLPDPGAANDKGDAADRSNVGRPPVVWASALDAYLEETGGARDRTNKQLVPIVAKRAGISPDDINLDTLKGRVRCWREERAKIEGFNPDG